MSETESGRRAILGAIAALGFVAVAGKARAQARAQGSVTAAPTPSPQEKPAAPEIRVEPGLDALNAVESEEGTRFRRPDEEQAAFDKLYAALQSEVPFLKAPLSGELDPRFRGITSSFVFAQQPGDESFNPFHVEVLLDQSGNILDRAIRERAQYEGVAADYFSVITELVEYTELDRIHREEEAAGIYDVEKVRSRSDLDAEITTRSMNQSCEWNANWYYGNFLDAAGRLRYAGSVQQSAWVSGLVPYYWDGQSWGGYLSNTWNGVSDTSANHYLAAAANTGWANVWAQEMAVDNERITYKYSAIANSDRIDGLLAKSTWEVKNSSFQRRRTIVARGVLDAKLRAAVDPNGVLNSSRRLPALRKRFELDFRNAIARLKAAEIGLASVYGYRQPLPADPMSLDYFDDCLAWTRIASDWMIRFARREQSFVIPVSLSEIIGRKAYQAGRKKRKWLLPITPAMFPEMTHVRLRGVTVFVDDASPKARLWRLKLTAPLISESHHASGAIEKLDQTSIRPVICSRVGKYDSVRDPDVNGTSTLLNASPLGTWQIENLGATPKANSHSALDDIIIHFITVYCAR